MNQCRNYFHSSLIVTTFLSTGFFFLNADVNAQSSGILTVEASNFRGTQGKATVNLFRSQDEIPKKPFVQLVASITNSKAILQTQDIPYGDYAAILFHDENTNGILDHRLGFPNEAMGFSNGWKLSLFSGMPTFEKLKFTFNEKNASIAIKL